ncbi:MAG: hypothetical protein ACK50D_12480, partial [Burkholderiales bacterium]
PSSLHVSVAATPYPRHTLSLTLHKRDNKAIPRDIPDTQIFPRQTLIATQGRSTMDISDKSQR